MTNGKSRARASSQSAKPLWRGRFEGEQDPLVRRFTRSLHLDRRLARYDIRGSRAHVRMLAETGDCEQPRARFHSEGIGAGGAGDRVGTISLSGRIGRHSYEYRASFAGDRGRGRGPAFMPAAAATIRSRSI